MKTTRFLDGNGQDTTCIRARFFVCPDCGQLKQEADMRFCNSHPGGAIICKDCHGWLSAEDNQ